MCIRVLKVLLSFGIFFTSTALVAQETSPPAEFQERISGWLVLGDFEVGACIAVMETTGPTSLSIASVPNRSELIFSVQNSSWASITNDSEIRINAIFRIGSEAVDGWSLDAVGMNAEGSKPGFRIEIENAKNDSANFADQFARSDTLELFNGKIPAGKFSLKKSKEAISLLYQCRAQLRTNTNFDPFAK